MAKIVLGVGASHTTLMNTKWDKVDHLQRAHGFKNALLETQKRMKAAKPDAVIILGSNHFRGSWLDLMPAFTVGVGDIDCAGEHGTPKGIRHVDDESAISICNHLIKNDFDVAFSTKLPVDHGISHAIQWVIADDTPIIPLVVNCFAPPLPNMNRCLSLAKELKNAIDALPADMRIAVVATGGISHQLPFPDWRKPKSDNDDFFVDSFKNGRGNWTQYEVKRREIIVNSPPQLNEEFDKMFLDLIKEGKLDELPNKVEDEQLTSVAGNGANEIRAWLMMSQLLDNAKGEVLCYSPMPEWLTGMAVAVIEPKN